ncbi:MAG TPA: transposase family protein [Anaerolineales bacterium]|nr:transposase family protein [Anaerolineales bacterium]
MLTYEKILRKSQAANGLIGMSLAEFEELYVEFERAHLGRVSASQVTQRHKRKRRRAAGAGRKHKYALRDRLLMTLFWLRAYTTYTVLGTLYDLDKTTVEDYLNHVLMTLSTMKDFHFESPRADVPKIRSLQEIMKAFPDVLILCNFDEPKDKYL